MVASCRSPRQAERPRNASELAGLVSAGDAKWVTDEDQTLGAADVPDGAPMIVLPAHRQPVR